MASGTSVATVTTVTIRDHSAILIMGLLVVGVNLAQKSIASMQGSAPTSEPMNAKVFATANKVSLSSKIFFIWDEHNAEDNDDDNDESDEDNESETSFQIENTLVPLGMIAIFFMPVFCKG